ncbi:MAG: serine/threonine-protein kinase, partial [Myxococcota bacterium]
MTHLGPAPAQAGIEVLSLLGRGGFGDVYRCRATSDGGFTREIAVKVLRADCATPELLGRLRDEARMLLLLRDRAIVSAEPPVRLGDQWAIVMEYVDGQSTHELLHAVGPFPPSVALEIVGEVARALDAAHHQRGPTGPLLLVHRDLKCANIQVTRSGEVKILDFGAAFASFDRESRSEGMVVGTRGYIAPERWEGIAGPPSDVYALGVTLFKLTTGVHPDGEDALAALAGRSPHDAAVAALVGAMIATDPDARPTARDLEARCRELARAFGGVSLTEWARCIPERGTLDDSLIGQRFSVDASNPSLPSLPSQPQPSLGSLGSLGSTRSSGSGATERTRPGRALVVGASVFGVASVAVACAVAVGSSVAIVALA